VGPDGHLRWLRAHFLLTLYWYNKLLNREKELNPSQDPCHWSLVELRFARIFVSPYSRVKTHVGLKLLEIFGNSILPQSHPTVTGSIPVCKNVCFPQVNQVSKVKIALLDKPFSSASYRLVWAEPKTHASSDSLYLQKNHMISYRNHHVFLHQ
jgi:hypothetical protein